MTLSKWNLENKMSNLLRLVACLFVVISSSSHAALYDRGNGLIYDDVLNITWLQDANYAQTSGYDSDGRMTCYCSCCYVAAASEFDTPSIARVGWWFRCHRHALFDIDEPLFYSRYDDVVILFYYSETTARLPLAALRAGRAAIPSAASCETPDRLCVRGC